MTSLEAKTRYAFGSAELQSCVTNPALPPSKSVQLMTARFGTAIGPVLMLATCADGRTALAGRSRAMQHDRSYSRFQMALAGARGAGASANLQVLI